MPGAAAGFNGGAVTVRVATRAGMIGEDAGPLLDGTDFRPRHQLG